MMDLKQLPNDEFLQGYTREMKELSQKNVTITLRLTPFHAGVLIGALQLACRHPGFTGPSKEIVRRIVDWMQSEFLQYDAPYIIEMIRRGWMKQYDEKGD
jgi:hypothetical protein